MEKTIRLALKPLAILLAAAPLSGLAQETTFSPVFISAPRIDAIPSNASRLDESDLPSLRSSTSDTASLLRDIPGISLYGAGGVSSLPAIHGMADDRIRIKVDGMDLVSACGNHMNSPLSYIDPSSVGGIKVFAGIAPVSAGGDSISGTIQVSSVPPEFAAAGQGTLLKGEAGVFHRSNGNAKGGNLSATMASERLSVAYRGSTAQSDDYKAAGDFKAAGPAAAGRGWLAGDEVGASMYKSTNQSLGFALRHENHLVELKLGVQDIPYQGFPNQRMDMTGNDSTQINLRYRGKFEWGVLEVRAYDEKTRHKMQFGDDKLYWYGANMAADGIPGPIAGGTTGRAEGMPMDTEGKNTGVALKADIVLSARDLVRVGGETQHYRLNDWWDPSGKGMWPNTFWNIRDGERDRLGIFAEWEAQWDSQWLTQFGVRHETVDMNTGAVQGYSATPAYVSDVVAFNSSDRKRTDHNLDLTALARYTPDATKTFEFGYGQKTRSPNLYERYAWSTGGMAMRMINFAGDGNGYVGNLALNPEVAHTLSATADWHDAAQKQWGLRITPYYTHAQDYVDAVRCSSVANANCNAANRTATTGFVYLQFANQSARLYGMDVSGRFLLAKTGDYGNFTATGVLNFVRGTNRTTDDNLYNIMPLNAKLAVVQRMGNWTNTVEAQLVEAKTNVSQVRNELKTGGYGLLNLRSSYAWKQARLDIGVENLLDKNYALPLGGAYTGQGKTMSGTDVPWGVAVPGMGRSIYTSLTVKF